MKRKLLFLIFLSFLIQQTSAQNSRWGLFAGGGTTWYYGDMNDRLTTHPKLFRYHLTGGIIFKASSRAYINAAFAVAKIVGADSLAIQDFNLKRRLSFSNDIWQITLKGEYRLIGYHNGNTRKVTPYIFGGVGYFHFNPVAELNGTKVALQPLGTEGQFINGSGNPAPYKLYSFNFPIGIGVEFRLTKAWAARVELTNHFTLTDYFDDVSTDYADSALLAAASGPVAVEMASNIAAGYPREGFGRGDPKQKTPTRSSALLCYGRLIYTETAVVPGEVTVAVTVADAKEKGSLSGIRLIVAVLPIFAPFELQGGA